jgi:hypothetical protein
MLGDLFTPFAVLLKLDFFGYEFFVLTGPVIDSFASPASKFYKSIL